ncbi:hypothetical protein [Bradyrhizobium sp.]
MSRFKAVPRALLVAYLSVFIAAGWTWGRFWHLVFSATAAARLGYDKGMQVTPEERARRNQEKIQRRQERIQAKRQKRNLASKGSSR